MRNFLTWLALFAFSAVSIVAVVRGVQSRWNHEPPFNRERLEAYLIAPQDPSASLVARPSDMASLATERRAARRLEQDFHEQFNWEPKYRSLSPTDRKTFETNFTRLIALLVRQHSEAYAATPKHRRDVLVEQRFVQFAQWYTFADGRKLQGNQLYQQAAAVLAASPQMEEDKNLREFVGALQSRGWRQLLGPFAPNNGPPRKATD